MRVCGAKASEVPPSVARQPVAQRLAPLCTSGMV
jgi:hypothetical protein